MARRPTNCSLCRWGYKTTGFTPTFVGETPKVALVFPFPDSEEVVEREALNSKQGRHFAHTFLEPYGLEKKDLVVSYVLRCLGPWDKKTRQRSYPPAKLRTNAEAVCRRYDGLHGQAGDMVVGGITGWKPDMFIFSFDPADCIRVPAYTRLIQRCVEKALHYANIGFRPCILFGDEAVKMQAPWISDAGGLKGWVGHALGQPWRHIPDEEYEEKKRAFLAA